MINKYTINKHISIYFAFLRCIYVPNPTKKPGISAGLHLRNSLILLVCPEEDSNLHVRLDTTS